MFTLIDWYASSWSLLLLALIEVVLVSWVYGAENLLEKMQTEMDIPIPRFLYHYWHAMWKFITPAVLFVSEYRETSCQFSNAFASTLTDSRLHPVLPL